MIVLKIIAFIWFCQTVLWITEIASRALRYRMNRSTITEQGPQRVPLVIVPKS